jgi:hypothetical protein
MLLLAASVFKTDVNAQVHNISFNNGDQDKSVVELSIYPNPASDYFTLNTNQKIKRISINTIVGKEVKMIQVNDQNRYDLSDLRKGIYVVRIFDYNDSLVKALRLSKS